MTHAIAIDNQQGSLTFGKEIVLPVTIIETPPLIAVAVRAYNQTVNGLRTASEAWMEKPPKDLARVVSVPEKYNTDEMLGGIEQSLDSIAEFRLLVVDQPRLAKLPRKNPHLLEVKIGGKSAREQFEFAKSILGKEVAVGSVFKEGEYVDVVGVTRGKGIQGPVKRWGIAKLHHKSRKTVRGVGSIGPWHPHYVVYTVPRAGQYGFHQRTEYNRQIVKISNDPREINPKGGFVKYGQVNTDYILVRGSVPGAPKRVITLRPALRSPKFLEAPKLEWISVESKQGA
jgi:large subunit ribosomal protein L3